MPVMRDFEIDGHRALIVKHDTMGHLCGYIALSAGHKLHGKHYDDDAVPHDVHGGWTYSEDHAPGEDPDGQWYFGFDCAHAGDLVPGSTAFEGDVYRDQDFVDAELRSGLAALSAA